MITKSKLTAFTLLLCLAAAVCIPASAQSDLTQSSKNSITIDLFAKEKNVKSGEEGYFAATVTDADGQPVVNQTVYFYQSVEISGINFDELIGEAVTNEKGIAVFKPVLTVNGNIGQIFVGCATEDAQGDAYYSDHVMVTVTNPDCYIEETDDEN